MTMDEWVIYTAAESTGISKGSTEDVIISTIDINDEIAGADSRFVEKHFAGMTLAGDKIDYIFNKWGQLQMKVAGHTVKGGIRAGIHKGIANSRLYFHALEEESFSGQWTIVRGIMFPNGSSIEVGILYHGESILGIYKKGTNLGRTIKWFEKKIFKTNHWMNMKTHSLREFRPEVRNDVYKDQLPEFTREDELVEILDFVTSLKSRRLSYEEVEILQQIQSELELYYG